MTPVRRPLRQRAAVVLKLEQGQLPRRHRPENAGVVRAGESAASDYTARRFPPDRRKGLALTGWGPQAPTSLHKKRRMGGSGAETIRQP